MRLDSKLGAVFCSCGAGRAKGLNEGLQEVALVFSNFSIWGLG